MLQELSRKKWKLQSSPCKLLPICLATGGQSTLLQADLLSGEEGQFFVASYAAHLSTCFVTAEQG